MKTVMLVDDERPARELLKLSIDWEKAGFRILWEARNGRQALEQYQQQKPDLIITDVQMPVMDGLELLKEIKRICPSQNIVILSCHENFSYARQALKYGVMDYLIKDALTEETLYSLLEAVKEEDSESFSTDVLTPKGLSILPDALFPKEGSIQNMPFCPTCRKGWIISAAPAAWKASPAFPPSGTTSSGNSSWRWGRRAAAMPPSFGSTPCSSSAS